MNKRSRVAIWTLFGAYCLIMFWLLFLQRPSRMGELGYWDTLRDNLNLMPLQTIKLFLRSYHLMPRAAMINIVGNVAVFIPAGLFLPCLWKHQRNFFIFSATVIVFVALVECAQLFTMVGSCDIDDLILNYAGALIGFCLFSLPAVKRGLIRRGWAK